MELLITFIILNVVNVILQTFKTIATVKFGKWGAAIVNAVAFGLYTVVIVYTVCDLPLWEKVIIVSVANLFGVYVVKYIEEKRRKDKLWKVECTLNKDENWKRIIDIIKEKGIPCNYIDIDKYILINCYCATQKDSASIKKILNECGAKYFVSETKSLD